MGCDIHLYTEKKINGFWNLWHKSHLNKAIHHTYVEDYYRYTGRNYDLFAILANVRNGVGFAGIVTGGGFNPICQPRGLPKDVGYEVQELSEKWDDDGHSHSWLTLRELLEYDWDSQSTTKRGVVSEITYKKWDHKGYPSEYCGASYGKGIETLSEEEYLKLNQKDTDVTYMIEVEWDVTYRQAANQFLKEFIPRLQELAEGDLDSVRIVFWFDN